jgi:hypothetical protein
MNGAIGEQEGRRQVVGHPFRMQFIQDREVEGGTGGLELAPYRTACRVNASDRIVEKIGLLEKLERSVRNLDFGTWSPNHPAAHNLRVQCADEHRHPPQRYAASDQPSA